MKPGVVTFFVGGQVDAGRLEFVVLVGGKVTDLPHVVAAAREELRSCCAPRLAPWMHAEVDARRLFPDVIRGFVAPGASHAVVIARADGTATRSTPYADRPRCNATTKKGEQCRAAVAWDFLTDRASGVRCRTHRGGT